MADARWIRWDGGNVYVGDSQEMDPDGPEVQDSLLRHGVTTQEDLLKLVDELQWDAANRTEQREKV